MKESKKQIYLNMLVTVAAVGAVCVAMMLATYYDRSQGEPAQAPTVVRHTSAAIGGGGVQQSAMPTISTPSRRAGGAAAAPRVRSVSSTAPTSSQSLVQIAQQLPKQSISTGGSGASSGVSNVSRSGSSAGGSVVATGFGSIGRGRAVATSGQINEPFADARPGRDVHQRVWSGGNEGAGFDEQFYEPIGDGVWFLLVLCAAFALYKLRVDKGKLKV